MSFVSCAPIWKWWTLQQVWHQQEDCAQDQSLVWWVWRLQEEGEWWKKKICTHRRPFGPNQGWGHEGAHQTAFHIHQVHLHRHQGAQGQVPSHIQVTPAHWGNQDRSRKTQQFLWEGVRFWSKEIWATKQPWHQLFGYYWGCILEPISNATSQPSKEFLKASILAAWPPSNCSRWAGQWPGSGPGCRPSCRLMEDILSKYVSTPYVDKTLKSHCNS